MSDKTATTILWIIFWAIFVSGYYVLFTKIIPKCDVGTFIVYEEGNFVCQENEDE